MLQHHRLDWPDLNHRLAILSPTKKNPIILSRTLNEWSKERKYYYETGKLCVNESNLWFQVLTIYLVHQYSQINCHFSHF